MKTDVLLIYPQLGSFDELLRDIPLSLIYAASDSVKHGYAVKILDLRLHAEDWKTHVDAHLQAGCSLVGLSVMTGNPITTSLNISKYIKNKYNVPIVWGGPHPTILPEQTLENENIDFVIRDWGSAALFQLIQHVKGETSNVKEILGLGYKEDGKIVLNKTLCSFETPDFHDLPYHLVDITSNNYNRLNNGEMIFPIFTAVGCPYKCAFCMSPAVYEKIKGKKWIPYDTDDVISHIEFLLGRYNFQRLQIYDDDSFVNLGRMHNLLSEYVKRGYHKKLKLDFRGARINELDKMDDDFLALMVKANVEFMAIGAESGSDDVLKIMNKGITAEQIIRVNKKLARFPSLKPHYNFFCGVPGETMESLIQTKDLILQLLEDHPRCYLGVGADWKPLPGSVMTDTAVRDYGLSLPGSLREWAAIDSYDANKIVHPWYTKKMNGMIKLLQIAGQVLDQKIKDHKQDIGIVSGNVLYFLANLYKPLLQFRLKHNYTSYMLEYSIRNVLFKGVTRTAHVQQLIKRFLIKKT